MRIEDALKTDKFRSEQHKAVLNLLYTAYRLRDNLQQSLKEFDITLEQFNVLRILRGSLPRNLCVKEIASRMIERSSNVPRILERLERKALIERNPSDADRRETVTIISQSGLALLEKLDDVMMNNEEKLLSLNKADALLLNQLLEQLRTDL
jgi:DNA-binding MarR family transcriptional regulator